MFLRHSRGLVALIFALAITSGCRCNTDSKRNFPEIDVQKTLIDFGSVQKDIEVTAPLRVYNAGADTLNISEVRTADPFSIKDELPIAVPAGTEYELQVAFKPTVEDHRYNGELVIVSDDPNKHEVTVNLAGAGVTAVAQANDLEFGDVYVNESKTVTVKIHNGGSNALKILGAEFTSDTPPTISGDLSTLVVGDTGVEPGKDIEADVKFGPTAITESIPGAIKLTLDPLQGGELQIKFKGRGVQAIPRLCFKYEDSPMEKCTDLGNTNLVVDVPALCDSLIYPEDAGTAETACNGAPYEVKGQFYIKNDGNVPVEYSMSYRPDVEKSCDGGTPERIDFAFSNSPDAGMVKWDVDTTKLPMSEMDPKPWETMPIDVTYRATAACPDEASDQAQIYWTRQGDTFAERARNPAVLSAIFTGKSLLPEAVPADISIGTSGAGHTAPAPVRGINKGVAEYQITDVQLFEVLNPVPGASCNGVDAGIFQACDFSNPVSDCYVWSYADGGDPNVAAPHTIPSMDGGTAGVKNIGTLVFNANDSATPSTNYCVYTVAQTTDPFHPVVISKIQGSRK